MATLTFTVDLQFNRFAEIADKLQPEADAIAKETGQRIIDGYRANAREDTGAQKASAYMVTANGSTYAESVAAAHGKQPGFPALPEVAAPDNHDVLVAIAAKYSVYNEYGVHGRAGDGVFTQSAELQRQPFNDAMAQLIERASS